MAAQQKVITFVKCGLFFTKFSLKNKRMLYITDDREYTKHRKTKTVEIYTNCHSLIFIFTLCSA